MVALEGDNHPTALLNCLLQSYIEHGTKALEKYDGQFALVIYNGREASLSVVSDTDGMFGIFYGQRGNRLFISTSALAIATAIQSPPDILAIEHFLRTGRLDADKTLWQDVKRLLGGMELTATDECFQKTEYWSPKFDKAIAQMPLNEAVDLSVDLLKDAFSRTLTREGKTWVDLTGGFDSRLAAMIVAKINTPFCAYCMGPQDHPDVHISRKVSEEMKWEYVHTELPEQWGADQYSWFDTAFGCGDGRISVLRLAVALRGFTERNATIKTNVMGVGGENFRGYRWQVEGVNIGRTSTVNYGAWLDNIFPSIPLSVMKFDRTKEVRQELRDFITELCVNYSALANTVQIDLFENGRDSGLGGAYLSAVSGIERSLAPFFFKTLVNFGFSLNYHWKLPKHHLFIRTLLERESNILANVATTTGGPATPIRLSNLHLFWPLWKNIANRVGAISSRKFLRKTIQIWPEPLHTEYPLPAWRNAFYLYAQTSDLLTYENMCSRGLYKGREFNAYIQQAEFGPSHNSEFVDHVISVEMAMRAVGSHID
ncbi:MAG: asparagine synthase-related protein [Anaerolineaceae bacterium]|nr:asparagine synthase-related protein [Anaerolineaceae bacterium]